MLNVRGRSIGLLILVIAILLVVVGVVLHCNWSDGFGYALCEFFMGATVYSPDYSERAYIGIKEGFTAEEVRKRLGEPLGVTRSDGCDYYNYSTWAIPEMRSNGPASGPASDYSRRLIIISNDMVIGKWHEYYFD
jgi:hypothetical protein